jgi:hypothetical protein
MSPHSTLNEYQVEVELTPISHEHEIDFVVRLSTLMQFDQLHTIHRWSKLIQVQLIFIVVGVETQEMSSMG